MKKMLIALWGHISGKRKLELFLLLILTLLASFAEIFSIGLVLPFLGILTDPNLIFNNTFMQPFINALGIVEPSQLVLPVTICFICATLFAGLVRLGLLWSQTTLAHAIGSDLSFAVFIKTLHQPYLVHISRNSSQIISGITLKINSVVYQVLLPILNILSSITIFLAILVLLMRINLWVSLTGFIGFWLTYSLIIILNKRKLGFYGEQISTEQPKLIKALQEGLGGIRDVIISNTQQMYCDTYQKCDMQIKKAVANLQFIANSPRYVLEAIGMSLIALIAYRLANTGEEINLAIPVLGAFAFGAQRMLPALQQIYAGWVKMRGCEGSLRDVLDLLNQHKVDDFDVLSSDRFSFNDSIKIKDVEFRYPGCSDDILKGINLDIKKGCRLGLVGATGSGKSTLLDLLMGLLEPTSGKIFVDQELITSSNITLWRLNIAHVPQNIYFSDSSIASNIAFGEQPEKINYQKVYECAQRAQIANLIDSLPEKYETRVGERGVKLSGGQLQRIGIARALYKNAKVIIFDEATSALDSSTESDVMSAIQDLSRDLTIIIVAHRISTLSDCDEIYEIDNGILKKYFFKNEKR